MTALEVGWRSAAARHFAAFKTYAMAMPSSRRGVNRIRFFWVANDILNDSHINLHGPSMVRAGAKMVVVNTGKNALNKEYFPMLVLDVANN